MSTGPSQGIDAQLYNIKAEDGVIAGLVSTNKDEIRDEVFRLLEREDFFSSWHKEAYQICKDMWTNGIGIDFVTVSDRIKHDPNKLNAVLFAGTVNTLTHAKIVKDLSVRRRITQASRDMVALASDKTLPVPELIDGVSSSIFSLADATTDNKIVSALSLSGGILNELQRRMNTTRAHIEIESGYRTFDDIMGGWHRKHFDIIAARPAMGKTALFLNFAARSCVKKKVPTLIFSLEMSKEELTWRMMPIISRIEHEKIKSGSVDAQEYSAVAYAAQNFSQAPLYIDDTPQKFSSMRVAIRNAKRRYGIQQVFIDYLQLIHPSKKANGKEDTRDRELTELAQGLKEVAKECDVNVCALSQLNRSLEAREDKRPLLSDLRESGGLEQAADSVLMLYRPNVYDATEDEHEAQLIIRKQRDGQLGMIPLYWDGGRFLFEDISNRVTGVPQI